MQMTFVYFSSKLGIIICMRLFCLYF
ncbi:unnamed protein product [Spirodela intermedia]|uniref:Uncharacterized protein n=2 Tax=Spirodela intermedia TaxID=51605 RepID=A0A7I8LKN0_SPIIN|nr:unnamed protein product [Spirodela intermedia]CAA6673148.1 unnamed protein product [Spirodela intermedia]CAA7410370.1 unnamed protein product [Spirodela intermedia]